MIHTSFDPYSAYQRALGGSFAMRQVQATTHQLDVHVQQWHHYDPSILFIIHHTQGLASSLFTCSFFIISLFRVPLLDCLNAHHPKSSSHYC